MILGSNPFSDFLGMWGFQWCEQTSQRNLHKYVWNFQECLFALIPVFESTLNCIGSLYCFLFFFIFFNLFFGCAGSSLLHAGFLLLQSTGSLAVAWGSMWDLPGPGIKPVSPVLTDGLLTTRPPGKSMEVCTVHYHFHISFHSDWSFSCCL